MNGFQDIQSKAQGKKLKQLYQEKKNKLWDKKLFFLICAQWEYKENKIKKKKKQREKVIYKFKVVGERRRRDDKKAVTEFQS